MQCDAALGIIVLIIMLFAIKDFPQKVNDELLKTQATNLMPLWQSIKKVMSNPQNWLFSIYTALINLPLFVFGAAFGISCLQILHGLTIDQAAFSMLTMFVGAMTGSPFFGWLSDRIKSRKTPMFIGGIVSLILILIVMYVINLNYSALCCTFFAIGFFTSAQIITYAVMVESNTDDVIATSLSFGTIIIMSSGVLLSIFGCLLDLHWSGKMINDIPLHSVNDYRFALLLLPCSFIVGMVAIMFGKETKCKKICLAQAHNAEVHNPNRHLITIALDTSHCEGNE